MNDDQQLSFTDGVLRELARTTKRAQFLDKMDKIVPWDRLCKLVAPHYPTGEGGRQPIDLERMLRIYFLQQWYNLSDPGAEEALMDIISMRRFVGIAFTNDRPPDETTLCKFRHLLEEHDLGKKMFDDINKYLKSNGIKVAGGTIVDATIISAPSSTKNQDKARDPEMHQTKKGNQWHFGMKVHIGVDSRTKVIHSVETTAANVHDSQVVDKLLHGRETRVWGDSAYTGKRDVVRKRAKKAKLFINKRAYKNRPLTDSDRETNRRKSSIRSRVEHVFGTIKGQFGFKKVRYRGLAKNRNAVHVLCALANIFSQRRTLLRLAAA
jgi:IS5 family transposase